MYLSLSQFDSLNNQRKIIKIMQRCLKKTFHPSSSLSPIQSRPHCSIFLQNLYNRLYRTFWPWRWQRLSKLELEPQLRPGSRPAICISANIIGLGQWTARQVIAGGEEIGSAPRRSWWGFVLGQSHGSDMVDCWDSKSPFWLCQR